MLLQLMKSRTVMLTVFTIIKYSKSNSRLLKYNPGPVLWGCMSMHCTPN